MSLSCYCGDDDAADWQYTVNDDFTILATKHGRKCCSCRMKIKPGDTVLQFNRWRAPLNSCYYIEEQIYGDEVPLAPWFMCETCGGLYMAVNDAGMCCDITENIAQQVRDWSEENRA